MLCEQDEEDPSYRELFSVTYVSPDGTGYTYRQEDCL